MDAWTIELPHYPINDIHALERGAYLLRDVPVLDTEEQEPSLSLDDIRILI